MCRGLPACLQEQDIRYFQLLLLRRKTIQTLLERRKAIQTLLERRKCVQSRFGQRVAL